MVSKIASSIGSKLYHPEISLSNAEKGKIIKRYVKEIKDSHQKDALAAGLKAFKNYHGLFLKVEEILLKLGRTDLLEDVIRNVVEKENENINDIIKKILKWEK